MKRIGKILQIFFFIFILCISTVNIIPYINVKAAGNLISEITADSIVRPNKSFDVYVDFYCDEGIGTLQATFIYDSRHLSLTDAKLENKSTNDFFTYSDKTGKIRFLVSNAQEKPVIQTIKFRFKPGEYYDEYIYDFALSFCEFCIDGKKLIPCHTLPSFSVKSSAKDEISKAESSGHISKIIQNNSASKNSDEETTKESSSLSFNSDLIDKKYNYDFDDTYDDYQNADISSYNTPSVSGAVYYIQENNNSLFNKNFFLAFIGIVIAVAAAVIYAYKSGIKKVKDKNHNEQNKKV